MSALSVLPIEHDLLMVARAAVGAMPARAVTTLLVRDGDPEEHRALAAGLSAAAKNALERTLAAGGVQALLRRGGWRTEVLAAPGEAPARARLWERQLVPLHFTSASVALLRWLTLAPVSVQACPPAPADDELHAGDELLVYLVCDLLASLSLPLGPLAARVSRSGLAQLAFPDALTDAEPGHPERIGQLVDQPMLLIGLQDDLTRQLLRLERIKAQRTRPHELEALSLRAAAGLSVLVDAARARGRVDLLRFVAAACPKLVELDGRHLQLDTNAKLQARQAARVAAARVLRVASDVATWHGELRHVGFVDDEFDRAQALLSAWEPYRPALERVGRVADAWSAAPGGAAALHDAAPAPDR